MINLSDLVRIKHEPPTSARARWLGVVVNIRYSAVGGTVSILWPQSGMIEHWASDALEVINESR